MTHTSIRVEPVDHRHHAWTVVLEAIFRTGDRDAVLLGDDGRLSSRQTVLAAFDGERVVGHLCFRIEPLRHQGRATVHSRIDSLSVEATHNTEGVEELLLDRAESQSHVMKCTPPRRQLIAC
jgi:hypothetical protein